MFEQLLLVLTQIAFATMPKDNPDTLMAIVQEFDKRYVQCVEHSEQEVKKLKKSATTADLQQPSIDNSKRFQEWIKTLKGTEIEFEVQLIDVKKKDANLIAKFTTPKQLQRRTGAKQPLHAYDFNVEIDEGMRKQLSKGSKVQINGQLATSMVKRSRMYIDPPASVTIFFYMAFDLEAKANPAVFHDTDLVLFHLEKVTVKPVK